MSQVKTFGRYNLVRKVAQGGMAEIFLAKFQGIGGFEKKIIIKRILPRFSENQEFIKMLIHEAKTAVQLHHQNIVQIYDLGKVRDTYYISMEYIRGKDLRTVLNRLKSQGQLMPQELAVFIAREICKGLDYAHNITDQHGEPLNLVHRDISPPNILLSLEGEVKIIDFGIAKATSHATDTQAGVFKGKFAYMAPEQAQGLPVDRRSDIFATGLILWEMMTCRKLLEAESDIATLERAKRIDSYEAPFNDYEIPEQVEHIIRKGLKQDRATRYQSAGEMARDLTIYLNLNYPGFSETDLADFLRVLFNLDRRRGGASGDVVSHGQGERSLTGSDFFRAFARSGADSTDPSVKLRADAARAAGAAAASGQVSATPPPNAAAAAGTGAGAGRRRRREGKGSDGEYWSLEKDIREEIEVFPMGSISDAQGEGGATSADGGQVGWESQVASDFVPADDGALHPLVKDGLTPGLHTGADDATVLLSDERAETTAHPPDIPMEELPPQASAEALPTYSAQPNLLLKKEPRSVVTWVTTGLAAAFIFLVLGAVAFPGKMQGVKESLGLVRKAEVQLSYSPADAEVVLNGQPLPGISSPARLHLSIGQRHLVNVHKEGFADQQVTVDLVSASRADPIDVSLVSIVPIGHGILELGGLLPGAVVYVNDRPTVEEQRRRLPVGEPLNVKVVKEHYLPFETQVTLGSEPMGLEVAMEPSPVKLTVDGAPRGSRVFINGKDSGACCPFEQDGFKPGVPYRVEVDAKGFKSQSTMWTPAVGSPFQWQVSLSPQPQKASHTVASRPRDRKNPVASTTTSHRTTKGASSGDSRATKTEPSKLTGAAPIPTPSPVGTEPQRQNDTVNITIFASPWAEVYVDGKYMGRTPVRNISVKAGRHKIRLVNSDLDIDYTTEKDINVTPHGESEVFNYDLG